MATFPPSVRFITNGTDVDAAVTNVPLSDLANRTDWLKDQIEAAEAGTQLLLRDRALDGAVVPGEAVYFDDVSDTFKGALADIDSTDLSRAAPTAFWQGVALNASGNVGDIVVGGSMTLTQATWATAFEDGVFADGDIFLSGTSAGKLTTEMGTTGIYLGHMIDDGSGNGELLVRLGNPGSFLEHAHFERALLGKPAGTLTDPAFGGTHVITTPDAGQQGWLPATAVYFPGFVVGVQIPSGAVFGYNISHASETELDEVFPAIPEGNAQFAQNGTILGGDLVVINQYGIWWMDDSYGNAPWPVDYNATSSADDVTLWTTRIIASSTLLDLVITEVTNSFVSGGADAFAVTSALSGDSDDLQVVGTAGDAVNGWRGDLVLTNLGVTSLRANRGIAATGPAGNSVTGFKDLVDINLDVELQAEHLFTFLDPGDPDPTEKMQLLTTNGLTSGTTIGAYGHRLGPNASDFIDFLVLGGADLTAATDYQLTVKLHASVDTPIAAPTTGDVDLEFYRFIPNQPMGDTQLQRITQATFTEGVPGNLQLVTVGPFADVILQQNEQILVRIKNSSGSPLTSDSFRLLSMYYGLTEV